MMMTAREFIKNELIEDKKYNQRTKTVKWKTSKLFVSVDKMQNDH